MATIVGIDLGTTNSLVAIMKGERPEIIANEQGKRLTPSVVGLDKNGKLHVGETAKNQLVAMPDHRQHASACELRVEHIEADAMPARHFQTEFGVPQRNLVVSPQQMDRAGNVMREGD